MESRILSLAALTVLELSPPDMVEAAARAGYSHVGLRLVPATVEEHHYPLLADAGLRRRTLARLRDSGVRTLDVEILRLRPDTRVGEFAAVLEVGAEFGARYVLVAGNDDDERRSADNFAALCDLARPLGLDPHLEFMPWTGIRDLRQAARVVERRRGITPACCWTPSISTARPAAWKTCGRSRLRAWATRNSAMSSGRVRRRWTKSFARPARNGASLAMAGSICWRCCAPCRRTCR